MRFFKRAKKQEIQKYDESKIYNLDKQFIMNIMVLKLPKEINDTSDPLKFLDDVTNKTIAQLSKFLNMNLNNEHENEKIKNQIKNYLSNLIVEDKENQEVGLFELDLKDLLLNRNKNQKVTSEEQITNFDEKQKEDQKNKSQK